MGGIVDTVTSAFSSAKKVFKATRVFAIFLEI